MSNFTDNMFGIHTQALGLWQKRAEVISSNLANADTPDYKARDVDFRQALAAASGSSESGSLQMTATSEKDLGGMGAMPAMNRLPTAWPPSRRWTAIPSIPRLSRPSSPATPCTTRLP